MQNEVKKNLTSLKVVVLTFRLENGLTKNGANGSGASGVCPYSVLR